MAPFKRILIFGALFALFFAALAQEKPETVTYSTVAKTADIVVAEIAEKTGLQLETKPDAKTHVLVVHVTEVPVEYLLKQIASVTSSKWGRAGDKRVLNPDTALRKRERAAVVAKTAEEIKNGLAKLKEQLAEEPTDNPISGGMFGGMMGAGLGSPAARALAQLALMLDPRAVAQLAEDGRIVFSTSANRMQRPMRGARVGQILNTLFSEHNTYVDRSIEQRQEMLANMGEENAAMMGFLQSFMGDTEPRKFESAPSKALLVVESGGMLSFIASSFQLELKVYDQEGNAIATGQVPLGSDATFATAIARMSQEEGEGEEEAPMVVDKSDLVQIEFSDKSRLYAETNTMDLENPRAMTPELRALLLDPVTHDPLSFTDSDALISVAKVKKLDLVANLPDGETMDAFMGMLEEQASTVGQALQMLDNSDGVELKIEGGWLIVTPTDRIAAREMRQDREALRALIGIAERTGTADLDTLAAFSLRSPKPMNNSTTMKYLGFFVPSLLQGMMGDTMDWDMLRFYGSLPNATKIALQSGNQVQFSAIGGNARGYLTKMTFGSNANIMPAEALRNSADEPQVLRMMQQFMPGGAKDYIEEPTEVMPNGLPSDGFVMLNVSTLPIVRAENSSTPTMFSMGALGPEEIAVLEFFSEAAGEMGAMMTQGIGQLRLGSRQNYRFTFWLSPEAGLSKTLHDDSVAKDGQIVSLTNLPPDFRALIAKAKEQIKNSPFAQIATMMGSMGQQSIDPPK